MAPSFRLRAVLDRLLVVAALVVLPSVVRAQDAPPPAYIAQVQGVVTLEHEGQAEPAAVNVPLVGGDRLFTENGRAEIVFPDGTSLAVEENSEVDFDSPTRFRVVAGAIERRPAVRSGSPSPYLPENLQTYAPALDESGTWEYDQPYGYVWYPTVAAGWRPYYDGYWADLRPYGWTWIGLDLWSWPTHHYGRWGFARNRWFWIPGRTWGPAYVSWGIASNYVSWCPLGPNNAPLFALSFGLGHTWSGWTFMPRSTFGYRGYYASHYAVPPAHIARTTPFIQERRLSIAAATPARAFQGRDRVARPFEGRSVGPTRAVEGRAATAPPARAGVAPQRDFRAQPPRTQAPVAVPRDRAAGYPNPTYRAPSSMQRTPASPYRPPSPEYRRAAPGSFPPMGDFRRPAPNPAYDYRRPIQEARPPMAQPAPEVRAPAGVNRAPQAVPRMEPQAAPRMERVPGRPAAPQMQRPSSAPRGTAVPRSPGAPAAPSSHAGRGDAVRR